jgi:hypothetical protein
MHPKNLLFDPLCTATNFSCATTQEENQIARLICVDPAELPKNWFLMKDFRFTSPQPADIVEPTALSTLPYMKINLKLVKGFSER